MNIPNWEVAEKTLNQGGGGARVAEVGVMSSERGGEVPPVTTPISSMTPPFFSIRQTQVRIPCGSERRVETIEEKRGA